MLYSIGKNIMQGQFQMDQQKYQPRNSKNYANHFALHIAEFLSKWLYRNCPRCSITQSNAAGRERFQRGNALEFFLRIFLKHVHRVLVAIISDGSETSEAFQPERNEGKKEKTHFKLGRESTILKTTAWIRVEPGLVQEANTFAQMASGESTFQINDY
jgi:hypothetical protein